MKNYQLNNGVQIPVLGFGTWQAQDGEEAYQAVREALAAGYRHIDTAAVYKNEESVGRAIKDSGLEREELFITTKLWNGNHSYEDTQQAFKRSMERLGLDYLDLYLIHWPNPKALREQEAWKERNAQVWRGMEDLYEAGKIRAIGVSNFLPHHLEPLLATARIRPAVNQIRLAPGVYQTETVDYCRERDILLEAWGPFGQGELFHNAQVQEIADRYGKTVAQIALAWSLQQGFLPLPKSVTPERIKSNLDCFDLRLSPEDLALLTQLPVEAGAPDPDDKEF